jgi:hypothetical protein
MSGRTIATGLTAVALLILETGLLLWLSPRDGLVGAAIASAIGGGGASLALAIQAYLTTRAQPLSRHVGYAIVAGAVAIVVGRLALTRLPGLLIARSLGALTIAGVVYVLALLGFGLHSEDRQLARRTLGMT